MRFLPALLPLSLLLASCAAQESVSEITASPDELTLALERYAGLGSGESDFQEVLTGSALVSALETQALLDSVGYRRLGRPSFEVIELSSESSRVCMDLSGIAIVNSEGERVETTGERLQVSVKLEDGLIDTFQVGDSKC
ncbi:MAG: hypothetical protein ACO4AA_01275 [Aquiluna sp.]